MAQNKRVFFSYSIADQAFADKLRNAMVRPDVEIVDPIELTPGDDVADTIQEALSQSDLFVYVIPEKGGSGKWSLFELGAAKALGKRIVAVLPDSSRMANSEVATRLADLLLVEKADTPASDIAQKILENAA
jgi:TIR domain